MAEASKLETSEKGYSLSPKIVLLPGGGQTFQSVLVRLSVFWMKLIYNMEDNLRYSKG